LDCYSFPSTHHKVDALDPACLPSIVLQRHASPTSQRKLFSAVRSVQPQPPARRDRPPRRRGGARRCSAKQTRHHVRQRVRRLRARERDGKVCAADLVERGAHLTARECAATRLVRAAQTHPRLARGLVALVVRALAHAHSELRKVERRHARERDAVLARSRRERERRGRGGGAKRRRVERKVREEGGDKGACGEDVALEEEAAGG
jgi:hypothetical protein